MRIWWQLSNYKVFSCGQTPPLLVRGILTRRRAGGAPAHWGWVVKVTRTPEFLDTENAKITAEYIINIRHSETSLCMDHFLGIHLKRNSQYINFPNGTQHWQGIMRRLHYGLIFHLSQPPLTIFMLYSEDQLKVGNNASFWTVIFPKSRKTLFRIQCRKHNIKVYVCILENS